MRRTVYGLVAVLAVTFALVSLLPVVSEVVSSCPPGGSCPYFSTQPRSPVSLTYSIFGVGGRVVGGHYQLAYLPGWTCSQTSSEVTVTSTDGTMTTTSVTSAPGTTCTQNVVTIT
jgi:hypothetical protein